MPMDEYAIIPYFAHEGEMSRMERTNKRLWILLIILILTLVGSNAAWIIYENQYADSVVETTVEQSVDTGDGTAVVSGTGDAIYGESGSTGNDTEKDSGQEGQRE